MNAGKGVLDGLCGRGMDGEGGREGGGGLAARSVVAATSIMVSKL